MFGRPSVVFKFPPIVINFENGVKILKSTGGHAKKSTQRDYNSQQRILSVSETYSYQFHLHYSNLINTNFRSKSE